MPTFSFSVLPGGIAQFHDILSCLVRFDENISLEAGSNSFRISSLNSSKSAHACFTLNALSFFTNYKYQPDQAFSNNSTEETWGCTLQNRALLSIFKKRNLDTKEKETALERCEVLLPAHGYERKCRLVIRMICRNGVVKTYKLIYEPANVLRANFDGAGAPNHWTTSSRTLRDIVEYFGPKTDQLDWSFEKGKVKFTSYTEKITDGRDIFKQPMHTSVAIERKDFHDFSVQEGLHIGIIVRDFRAIVTHADGLGVGVTARYSRGNRPMRIIYEKDGILCEFTLMTRNPPTSVPSAGHSRTSTPVRDLSVRPAWRPQSQNTILHTENRDSAPKLSATIMPPPGGPASFKEPMGPVQHSPTVTIVTNLRKASRNGSQVAPSASGDQRSLFFPVGEDERFWDEDNDTTEQEDFVTWDASGRGPVLLEAGRRTRDIGPATSAQGWRPTRRDVLDVQEVEPTQRLSQLKGLFD